MGCERARGGEHENQRLIVCGRREGECAAAEETAASSSGSRRLHARGGKRLTRQTSRLRKQVRGRKVPGAGLSWPPPDRCTSPPLPCASSSAQPAEAVEMQPVTLPTPAYQRHDTGMQVACDRILPLSVSFPCAPRMDAKCGKGIRVAQNPPAWDTFVACCSAGQGANAGPARGETHRSPPLPLSITHAKTQTAQTHTDE